MFPIAQVIIGIILLALIVVGLFWWAYKPLGKKLRKSKKEFMEYINEDEK